MLIELRAYLPTGIELSYLEFEVHKDPIRTRHSNGVQYRIKLKGNHPLPEAVALTGLVELYDSTSPYFWVKKCIRISLKFRTKVNGIFTHNLYLLPMSTQFFQNNTIQLVCMDISEKIMDLEVAKSLLRIDLKDFTSYFKERITESNNLLNDSFNNARKVTNENNLKKIGINVTAKGSEITRSNNTIISGTTMQLADYLINQGWFECPNYSIYDSFNLEAIATSSDMYTMRYDFLNLGDLKNIALKPKKWDGVLNIGETKSVSPFFETDLVGALNNKDSTFDFTKGGGYDVCIDDGSTHQNTNARIEMNVIAGSKENTVIKICCLKQLVELKPYVYTASIAGYIPLEFSIYSFGLGDTIDLPIVINYLFKPMSSFETGRENFTVTTNFETLRINSKDRDTLVYKDLAINGEKCSDQNKFN